MEWEAHLLGDSSTELTQMFLLVPRTEVEMLDLLESPSKMFRQMLASMQLVVALYCGSS